MFAVGRPTVMMDRICVYFLNCFLPLLDIIGVVSSGVDLNDPSRSGNYTVTFVPLISVIANYLPIFLKRLRTQEIISARSRSIFAYLRIIFCAWFITSNYELKFIPQLVVMFLLIWAFVVVAYWIST